MAGAKEIRTQIKSVKNTQKITRAMEMVAASKMRKAQERMEATRPYATRMLDVISHLAKSHAEYQHQFMIERPVKRVGIIIISTDRGLCGGLNINLFKRTLNEMKEWHDQGIEIDLCIVGSKAEAFFKRFGANIISFTHHLGDAPSVSQLIGGVKVMLDRFNEGKIDRLLVFYNQFVNTMTQSPHMLQLLPLKPSSEETLRHHWDYIYEPDAKDLLEGFLVRYIESEVYQSVVENIACEQAARMVAMKAASDNAGELIKDLQLAYNKARQAAITQELSEIISGAAAV